MPFESNFKKALDLKGFKQTDLLIKILEKCGEKNYYEKVNSEKSNFTNMIKGKRPFKVEYVRAIEELLELRFSDLYKEEEYIPRFYENKGIRYAAATDKIEEYERVIKEINNVFIKNDEYGKSIFDYICEYNSKNGLDYLFNKLNLHCTPNRAIIVVNGEETNIYEDSILKIVKMICQNNKSDYFNMLFPPNFRMGYRYLNSYLFHNDNFYKYILSSDSVINELLKLHDTTLDALNGTEKNYPDYTYKVYHPILIRLLEYALTNSNQYMNQLNIILDAGIKNNEIVIMNLRKNHNYKYSIDEYNITNKFVIYGYILNVDLDKYSIKDIDLINKIKELNSSAKKVEIKPSSKDIDFKNAISPNELFNAIYEKTNIKNSYSSSDLVFMQIERFSSEANCKVDKLGDGLLNYLNNLKSSFNINDLNREYEYYGLCQAISFAELYRNKLNNL